MLPPINAAAVLASLALVVLPFPAAAEPGTGEIVLPSILGDNMVLQRNSSAALWGWAEPNTELGVLPEWTSEELVTTVGADGTWRVDVPTPDAGGPYWIRLRAGADGELLLENVLVGEVWICGGQSNMEMPVADVGGGYRGVVEWESELEECSDPELRLFDVPNRPRAAPARRCGGAWSAAEPETVAVFSAVGYFFGRELRRELGVPVGLIGANYGGTAAEAWTSAEALGRRGDFATALAELEALRSSPERLEEQHRARIESWWETLAREDPGSAPPGWQDANLVDASWPTMRLPGNWEDAGLSEFDGVVWFRREVLVPGEWVDRELVLELGPIDDMDTVWVNGRKVGATQDIGAWREERAYVVPPGVVRSGANSIAVRVLDTGGAGGIYGPASALRIRPAQVDEKLLGSAAEREREGISLAGPWRYHAGAPRAELPPWPLRPILHPNTPSALFNGMIAPIVPVSMRGVIWYQGESNRTRAEQYATLFPDMIADWRARWGRGDFPFLFVQIAPYRYADDAGETALLREAQARAAATTPNTGMVVTMDVGDPADIHPAAKQVVGQRLALLALRDAYGRREIVAAGPTFRDLAAEGGALRVSFTGEGSGLVAEGGELQGFEVAGADLAFVPASARIEEGSVKVWSERVTAPLHVRYGWAADVRPTLANQEGLPAAPFRAGVRSGSGAPSTGR